MTLTEIKNLTYQELKDRREELVKLAGGGDLAAAFVQSLADAKMRDEKLAEQGVTITNLNDALAAAKQCYADSQFAGAVALASLADLQTKHDADCKCHAETCGKLQSAINELGSKLTAETARANRLAALCARSEGGINQIAKIANDLIAARQVETTNEG